MARFRFSFGLAGLCLLVASTLVAAAEITVPLTVRHVLLQQELARHVYTDPDGSARVWRESDCRYLILDRPRFSEQAGLLRFTTHGVGSLGAEILDQCLRPGEWRGYIESLMEPQITPDWRLRLKIVDSNLYDEQWTKGLLSGLLWEVTKRFVHPKLTALTLDLTPPRDEILALLQASAPSRMAIQFKPLLDSAVAKHVEVREHGVVVFLGLTLPDIFLRSPPAPTGPEPPLSPTEIAGYRKALERWDAFLVFVVKDFGGELVDPYTRGQLFELLLTSRYQVLPILTGQYPRSQGDPVRRLFVQTWKRLHDIVQEGVQRGLFGEKLSRYLGFIDAGDALLSLDQAAPGLGVEISADGLRRLARMLRPDLITDPLQYDWNVDPGLRILFGFPPELPMDTSPEPAPESGLEWVPAAHAAAEDAGLKTLMKQLDRWAPKRSELDRFTPVMEQLLKHITEKTVAGSDIDGRYQVIYRAAMPATALKESCWRQFERKGKVTYLKSSAGSVGLMQVNPHVWRGFYDVEQLKWNTAYNGQAGAEILMKYFTRYGIEEGKRTGRRENAARAAYAVYNAGPSGARRYRAKGSTKRERKVDDLFWDMYRGFANEGKPDLWECSVANATAARPEKAATS